MRKRNIIAGFNEPRSIKDQIEAYGRWVHDQIDGAGMLISSLSSSTSFLDLTKKK
jgi:hypothetical protein